MKIKELERRFSDLISHLRTLDWGDGTERMEFILDDARDLIRHGESGVALENICQNLYEFSVPIRQSDLDELKVIGEAMQMPSSTWEFLKEIVA